MALIYEDNHLIAVFKPAGVLVAGDATVDRSLFEEVKIYLKEKYMKPGRVFLGLLHRLDRPVAGIVLFAKTSKGASRLSEQFRNQQVKKTYHALILGRPTKDKGTLINYLGKDEKLKKAKEYKDGKESVLHYEVIKSNGKYSLLKINIEGGKFHQIRAQLALAGLPILGDVKYSGSKWHDEKSIALCATGLEFKVATEDKIINLKIDLPKEWEGYLVNF